MVYEGKPTGNLPAEKEHSDDNPVPELRLIHERQYTAEKLAFIRASFEKDKREAISRLERESVFPLSST